MTYKAPLSDYVAPEWAKQRAAKIIAGVQTTYNPETHIPALINLFKEGKDICHFCNRAEISTATFHLWVNTHKDFSDAYKQAKNEAFEYYLQLGADGLGNPSFNNGLWSMMMKNRFGFTADRKVQIRKFNASKTALEDHGAIKEEIADGNLTASEITHLSNFTVNGIKIEEHTNMRADVDQLLEQANLKDKR